MNDLTVLKLGGALLTDKRAPDSLRAETLTAVTHEIRACLDAGLLQRLIVVTGVGSFGHPPVLRYKLHKGFQSPDQLLALTETQNNVMRLRRAVAEEFQAAGMPVCLMLPSSCMAASGFAHAESYLTAVAGFLRLGMVPLLGGDVLVDDQVGFMVYGGDEVAVDLALHFGADRLILATQVDGIYDKDPQQHPDAQRLPTLSLNGPGETAVSLDHHPLIDASGAMAGKLRAIRRAEAALAAGLEVWLISMMEPGRLTAVLQGDPAAGTRVTL
ncbi:MAG: hypothetical protein IPM39_01355 [Chloroflexi bacterium]|nr:hypothetical protein [Chloroflexota bacterium]